MRWRRVRQLRQKLASDAVDVKALVQNALGSKMQPPKNGMAHERIQRTFDIPRAMARLRSTHEEIRRQALRRLHIRWYHATAHHMQQLLKAAGAPAQGINEVPSVVQGCLICKDWQRPQSHSVTSVRLVLEFNSEVQFDFWFYHSLINKPEVRRNIGHCIDACLRFSANGLTESKNEIDLLTFISRT